MAKEEAEKPPGWAEPPLPLRLEVPGAGSRRTLTLRDLLVAISYFAVVCASGREAMRDYDPLMVVATGVLLGLGLVFSGLWVVAKLPRSILVGWVLFVFGYMMIMFATISGFALLLLPVVIGSVVYLSLRSRATNQEAMLGTLAAATEARLPLIPSIVAHAGQASGMAEVWAVSLAELLRRGMSLPQAIGHVPRVVPHDAPILIRMGWESGNLAAGLRQAIATRARQVPILREFTARLAYLFGVVSVGQGVVGFVMYFIIPKFEAIFKDFGIPLPAITVLVIKSSHFVVNYAWAFFLGQVAVLAYLAIGYARTGSPRLPLFDRLLKRRHTVLIMRSLSVVIAEDRPILPALYSLAQWYPAGWVRRRLEHASERAATGLDPIEALRQVGLFSPVDAEVLEASRRVGNLPWALNELAETGERRWGYRMLAWTQVLFVAAMLALGGVVLMLSVAYFVPLIALIERLSQ